MRLGILCKKLLMFLNSLNQKPLLKGMGSEKKQNSPTTSLTPTIASRDILHLEAYANRFEGKLLLREEIPLSDKTFQQLLANHHFHPVPAMLQEGSRFRCTRCQNNSIHLFASMSCARCHKEHLYCRQCIQMGRVMACESLYRWNGPSYKWKQQTAPCTWLGKLSYAQQLGADEIKRAVQERTYIIIWAVTGAGKTEMLFPAMTLALQKGLRICIASPRADVVRELLPRFRTAFRDTHIQGLYGGSHDNDGTAQLIVTTTHQLYRYEHAFDIVIIDEVDAYPYHQDPLLPLAVHRASKIDAAQIHLTATPRKAQLNQIASKEASVVFVPIRFHGHPLIIPEWKIAPRLKKAIAAEQLPNSVRSWLEKRQDRRRQLLIFVPTIALAKKLASPLGTMLKEMGDIMTQQQITNVHAEDKDREKKVVDFRQRKIYALVTTTILERGVTFPSVDVIVLDAGHEVFDEAALVQISGRAGRSANDPDGEVVFVHDGLTDAMVKANENIVQMNRRRSEMLQGSKRE